MAFRGFKPLFDRVLVQRVVAETQSKGGILLPGAAKQLPIAKVLTVGQGIPMEDGSLRALSVAVGDKVLLPEFGGQTIKLDGEEYDLYRDAEFLGKFEDE